MGGEVWLAVPGDPTTLTGGYIYAAQLTEALRGIGWRVHRLALPANFPTPQAVDLDETIVQLRTIPAGATTIIDGLAYGAFPPQIFPALDLDIVALVHHPLAYETGTPADRAAYLRENERAALSHARAVIATSAHTAAVLSTDFAVARVKITVALPGVPRPATVPMRRLAKTPELLTVATLTPRKAYDVLTTALAEVDDLRWHSTWVGSAARDPEITRALTAEIARLGLGARITMAGETASLAPYYAKADVFVLPSRYEGYGMAFAEALAYGLPVIGCRAGAVVDTVPEDAGLLVPPDDGPALADALRRVLTEAPLYDSLAAGARRAAQILPTWADTARAVAAVLRP